MRSSRTEDVWSEPGCNLACAVCDCRSARSVSLERTVASGGARLEIRGEAATQRGLAALVGRAHAAGWARVAVRTNATAYRSADRARALRDIGVDEVVFFLASERASTHDAIARVRGAHAAGLLGARALADAGLAISLEIPVLSPSLQDLVATVRLAHAATAARRLRIYSPGELFQGAGAPPRELLPPRWTDVRGSLSATADLAAELGISFSLAERDGVPLCGILADGETRALLPERDQRPLTRGASSRLGRSCEGCAARAACPGVTELYLSVHGDAGLEPRTQRAGELVQRKVRPDAMWDDRRRESARAQYMTVLRPTVDCNQDCWFCSANETSRNVQRDAARMSRKILRLARTGITHLSFSGGEPTLSRHLLEHVALARAAGIPVVELVTNAVLLDREDKVDAFVRAGVTNLFVSLHGHDEATSRAQTRKVGDHARTTRALQLFVARSDVLIRLNHVITAKNFRSLVRFVEWVGGLFGPRVSISFAYLTPQYKALERLGEVLPTYTEVMPYLKKALARATELGIECVVGSRQGVPACLLGDFAILSDVTGIASNAEVEDARQKIKPPSCASCRLNDLCTGVWRPYAEVHGTGELVPMSGPPIAAHDDLADALGVRALPPSAELVVAPEPPRRRALDVLPDLPPLRVAIVGTGARALRILSAAAEAGLVVVGVASPHAPDKELPLPSEVTRARSLDELVATNVQIDAVIVASATRDHAASARAALSRGLPVLVEKPLAADAAEATALVELGGANLAVAHQMRMAGGFQELVREARAHEGRLGLRVRHAVAAGSAGAMHTWSRGQLFESLVHLLDLVTAILGVDVVLESARGVGATLPESMDVSGRGARGTFHLSSELRAADDGLEVVLSLGARRVTFQRGPGGEELTTVDALGARSRSAARGSDHTRMLEAWARSVREGKPPPVGAEDGVVAMRLASDAIRRLEASGVPFDRAHAPRHASSRELKERYD